MIKAALNWASNKGPVQTTLDASSIGATILSLLGWLPHATALLSFIWMAIRVYETDTVQKWLGKK